MLTTCWYQHILVFCWIAVGGHKAGGGKNYISAIFSLFIILLLKNCLFPQFCLTMDASVAWRCFCCTPCTGMVYLEAISAVLTLWFGNICHPAALHAPGEHQQWIQQNLMVKCWDTYRVLLAFSYRRRFMSYCLFFFFQLKWGMPYLHQHLYHYIIIHIIIPSLEKGGSVSLTFSATAEIPIVRRRLKSHWTLFPGRNLLKPTVQVNSGQYCSHSPHQVFNPQSQVSSETFQYLEVTSGNVDCFWSLRRSPTAQQLWASINHIQKSDRAQHNWERTGSSAASSQAMLVPCSIGTAGEQCCLHTAALASSATLAVVLNAQVVFFEVW